jgi:hypothetical protein
MKPILFAGLLSATGTVAAEYECWTSLNDGIRLTSENIQAPQILGDVTIRAGRCESKRVTLFFTPGSEVTTLEAKDGNLSIASATFDSGSKKMMLYAPFRTELVPCGSSNEVDFYIDCDRKR